MTKTIKRAIYAGTFDPLTNGHVWVIARAAHLFDELIIALGENPDKKTTYTVLERRKMLQEVTDTFPNVRVETYAGQYLAQFAVAMKAPYLIRGLRSVADYEYEKNMRYINADIAPEITTLFLLPPREYAEVSSTLIKGLVGFAGWEEILKKYVPEGARQIMLEKYHGRPSS